MGALREKYLEMRSLREEHARGEERDPQARLRVLATRFPGALREIDELPMAVIDGRLAELDAVERGELALPEWARAQLGYHGWMRAAIAVRRAAGRDRDRDRARAWIALRYQPGEHDPSVGALTAQLDAVLRPPGGRLNRWLFALLAAELGTHSVVVEALVFPHAHRTHRSDREA